MINIRDNLVNRKIKGSVSLPIFNNHFTAKIKVSRLFLPNYCLLFLPYRIHQSLDTILFSVSIWPLHHWKPTQLTLYCNQTIQTFPERGERSTIWGSQVENMTNHSQLWIKREKFKQITYGRKILSPAKDIQCDTKLKIENLWDNF